jgi:hypothetical protein
MRSSSLDINIHCEQPLDGSESFDQMTEDVPPHHKAVVERP